MNQLRYQKYIKHAEVEYLKNIEEALKVSFKNSLQNLKKDFRELKYREIKTKTEKFIY